MRDHLNQKMQQQIADYARLINAATADGLGLPAMIFVRGLPGSGKSELTRRVVRSRSERGRPTVCMNGDDTRRALTCRDVAPPFLEGSGQEAAMDYGLREMSRAMLSSGTSVVVDRQSLDAAAVGLWVSVAAEAACHGPRPLVVMLSLHVPVETCLERVAHRQGRGGRGVDERYIREQAERYGIGEDGRIPPLPGFEHLEIPL